MNMMNSTMVNNVGMLMNMILNMILAGVLQKWNAITFLWREGKGKIIKELSKTLPEGIEF